MLHRCSKTTAITCVRHFNKVGCLAIELFGINCRNPWKGLWTTRAQQSQGSESLYIWRPCFTARKNQKETENLTTPHDVPPQQFIDKLAKYLKENVDQVHPPAWAEVAKTGSHVEKQPQNPDWWYTRSASILRKIYAHEPMGLEKLRADYGGRKGFTVKPSHAAKGGGSNIRKILQQLEAAGLVQTATPKGRKMTAKGRKLLQEVADDLHKELVKTTPELSKYRSE
jgi:small subunit ribosomal protein S19e